MSSLAEQLAKISNPIVDEWDIGYHNPRHTVDLRRITTTQTELLRVPGRPKEPHRQARPPQPRRIKAGDRYPNKGQQIPLGIFRTPGGTKPPGAA